MKIVALFSGYVTTTERIHMVKKDT